MSTQIRGAQVNGVEKNTSHVVTPKPLETLNKHITKNDKTVNKKRSGDCRTFMHIS